MGPRLLHWALMTPDDLDAAIEHLPLALVPCGSLEWQEDLAEAVTPEAAQELFDDMCDALAEEIPDAMGLLQSTKDTRARRRKWADLG